MPEVITLGETMVAFCPKSSGVLRYVTDYNMRIAGAESNFAIGMAKLGREVGWISRLGQDEFGHYILNMIRGEGVDTSHVIFDLERPTGVMFKEMTAQETKVYYYRAGSAASSLSSDDLPQEYIAGAKIVHLTGITPVLSRSCLDAIEGAFSIAEKNNLLISFDPNIRKKLWGNTDYSQQIRDFTLRAGIVLIGLDEAQVLFDNSEPDAVFDILRRNGNMVYAALKDGANGAWVADRYSSVRIHPYPCNCVDPIGAGDAFNAAFITGILEGDDIETCGRMGGIAGALATQTTGDIEGFPSLIQMKAILDGQKETFR